MVGEGAGAGVGGGEKEHEIRKRRKSEIKKRRRGVLSDYEVYVTCEPCVMCSAALGMLGVHRVVMGCSNGAQILRSQYIWAFWSKYTRALTFENFCQPSLAAPARYLHFSMGLLPMMRELTHELMAWAVQILFSAAPVRCLHLSMGLLPLCHGHRHRQRHRQKHRHRRRHRHRHRHRHWHTGVCGRQGLSAFEV